MSSNGNAFTAGQTYQSIIIALVAGGILTTGVMSIIWRRRSRREWAGMNLRFTDGRGFLDPGGRTEGTNRRNEIGKEPELYDIVIGAGEVSEKERIVEEDERKKGEDEQQSREDRKKEEELDLQGTMKSGWNVGLPLISSLPKQP